MQNNLSTLLRRTCAALACLLLSHLSVAQAVTLPPGFTESVFFSTELNAPTAVRFSSDGRIFIAEKDGQIKVFDNLSDTSATLVHDFTTNVNSLLDRGLMGLALHPNFPAIPYIYVLYTFDKDPNSAQVPRWGDACPNPPGATTDGCVVSGRLSRIELAPGSDVSTGIETVLIEGWGQQFPSHSMDGLMFGPDGALYATAGDGANFLYPDYGQDGIPLNPLGDPPVGVGGFQTPPTAEGGATRTQSLRRVAGPAVLNGTIIRVDPATGGGLPDNPLFANPDPNAKRIVGYGFRNPFRFTIRPGTNELWVGDVGWSTWEEIDRIPDPLSPTVKNFGWPCYEGDAPQAGYQSLGLTICQTLYNTPGGHTLPYFQYNRNEQVVSGETCPTGNSSITGLAFYPGGAYPSQYTDALFFADSSRNCIWVMFKGANGLPDPATRQTFGADAASPVDLQIGPGGDLFYVDVFGALRRIQFASGNQAPTAVIQASALSGPLPLTITFDGTTSSDPNAGDTLTYSWDLNGDNIFDDAVSAQTSFQFTQTRLYNVKLRVTDNHGASHTASILISAGNSPPTAFIDTPTSGAQWLVGQSILLAGHGTDQEEGTLPASAFSWQVILHHCPSACHEHFLQSFSGTTTASFPAPDHEYPSHLEIRLTVTDAWGLKDTKSLMLNPQTVTLDFQTVPSGLQLVIGSDSLTTPFTKPVILGSNNLVSAVTPQSPSGTTLNFVSWSDGGNQSHFILANASGSYTATFSQAGDTVAPTTPINLVTSAVSGTQAAISWAASTDNIGVTGYEVERCQGAACTVFALVGTPTSTNQYDTDLIPNTSYSYRVRSRDAVGNFSPYTPLSTTTTFATLSDTFDRADNLQLGATWDPYTSYSPLQLLGNSVRASAVNTDSVESYNAVALPNDQWAQATLTGWNGTPYHNAHVNVRLSGTPATLNGYAGLVTSTNKAVIAKWTNNAISELAFVPYTPAVGDVLRLEAQGTTLRFWVNNVLLVTATDASYAGGRPGLTIYLDQAATTDQVQLDNFLAGEWTSLTEWQQVDALALTQLAQSQGQGILLVGDSLTNRNPLTTLCDRPVIRAGYEGGTWHDVKLRPIWPTVQAQTALVLLGTNDAFKTFPLDAAWLAEVQSFLSVLHAHANQVFLVLPPPLFPGSNTTPAAIQRIQEIATLLSGLGEQTVDARVIQDPQHFLDHIHFSASGYALLNSLYGAAACPASDTTPPGAPAGLTATPLSETQIAVSWPAATDNVGVTGYDVERCQGASCTTFALIATPTATSFGDTGLTAGTTYRYQVRARDAAGLVSLYSPIATATTLTPDTTPPLVTLTAPADGASVAGLVSVSATASDNVGVAGVQFLLDGSPLGAEVLTAPYALTWNSTTVVNGSHTLAARARDAAGLQTTTPAITVTVANLADTTPPTAPATLTASPISGTQITLSWPAATDNVGVTGYDVERCQGASCTIFALIATPVATSFGDAGLTLGTTYRYQVRARDAVGNVGLYSPIATATTLAAADNFDRADNLNLGAAWDPYTSYSPLQLLGNSVRASAVNTDSVESYNAVALPNDQWAQATLTGWNGTPYHNAHVNVRLSGTPATLNGYAGLVTSTNKAVIAKWTNNAISELAFVPYTPAVGDVLRLEAQGTTLRFWVNNVLLVTATDASYAGGRPGLTVYLDATAALSQVQLDNFSAGSLSGSGTLPEAPTGLNLTPGTSFRFTWNGVAGATAYRLLEDSTGTGSFAQVGGDLITTSYFHSVALWQRVNAQYVVQACNTSGCTNSAPLAVSSLITNAIGYLKASGSGTGDSFGVALALSTDGNTLAVGAYAEDGIALDSGAAYVFTRSDGIWTQQAYLKASNAGNADSFGVSIALSGDGNTLAVGAYHEDSNATGVNGDEVDNSAPDAGATYVFTRNAGIWSQQAYLKASNTDAGDVFGVSVTLSNDGNTLVVGGYREDSTATGVGGNQTDNSAVDSGAAYVFTRSAGIWSQQAYLKASNTEGGDHFGSWIYLSGDGLTLAVGARFEDSSATGVGGNQADNGTVDSGAVYVFARSGSVWSQEAYLKASNAGSGDLFGAMVTLSNDGNTLAVGARQEDSNATGVGGNQANNSAVDSGAAYVFTRSAGTWSQQAYLKASNTGAGDWFGVRVVLSSDGDTLAVGAQNEESSAIGINGNQANNSAPDAGAVYIFRRNSGVWNQETYLKASNTFTGDLFGDWIALSADGKTLAVGAQNENGGAIDAGAVYMY